HVRRRACPGIAGQRRLRLRPDLLLPADRGHLRRAVPANQGREQRPWRCLGARPRGAAPLARRLRRLKMKGRNRSPHWYGVIMQRRLTVLLFAITLFCIPAVASAAVSWKTHEDRNCGVE